MTYVSFRNDPITLWTHPYFLVQDAPALLYIPCPSTGIIYFSEEPWFLLVEKNI